MSVRATRQIREIIEKWQRGEPLGDDLYELERSIIRLTGRYEGTIMTVNNSVPPQEAGTYTAGKLEATEKHLEDMRRLVLLENEKGDVE